MSDQVGTPEDRFSRVTAQMDLSILIIWTNQMSHLMRKPTICICENKDADQLCGYREADQCLCFRYMDSTLPLLLKLNPKYQASSLLL